MKKLFSLCFIVAINVGGAQCLPSIILSGGTHSKPFLQSKSWIVNVPNSPIIIKPDINVTLYADSSEGYILLSPGLYSKPNAEGCFIASLQNGCDSEAKLSEYTPSTINLFPNPSSGAVHIVFDSTYEGTIQLINSLGLVVLDDTFMGNKLNINIDFLPVGTYFVRINTPSKVYNAAVLKK